MPCVLIEVKYIKILKLVGYFHMFSNSDRNITLIMSITYLAAWSINVAQSFTQLPYLVEKHVIVCIGKKKIAL